MQPTTTQPPKLTTPIMDVLAPVKPAEVAPQPTPASTNNGGVVEAPQESTTESAAEAPTPTDAAAAKKPAPKKATEPKPAKTSSAPVLAIVLALVVFLVLSGLAYYAYTKNM